MFNFSFKPNRLIFRSSESPTSSSEGVSPKTTMQELSTVLGKGLHEIKKGETTIQAIKRVLNKKGVDPQKSSKLITDLQEKYSGQLATADQENQDSFNGQKPKNGISQKVFFTLTKNKIVISHLGSARFSEIYLKIEQSHEAKKQKLSLKLRSARKDLAANIRDQYYQQRFFQKTSKGSLKFKKVPGWRGHSLKQLIHPSKTNIVFKPKGSIQTFTLNRIDSGSQKGQFETNPGDKFPSRNIFRGRVSIYPGDEIITTPQRREKIKKEFKKVITPKTVIHRKERHPAPRPPVKVKKESLPKVRKRREHMPIIPTTPRTPALSSKKTITIKKPEPLKKRKERLIPLPLDVKKEATSRDPSSSSNIDPYKLDSKILLSGTKLTSIESNFNGVIQNLKGGTKVENGRQAYSFVYNDKITKISVNVKDNPSKQEIASRLEINIAKMFYRKLITPLNKRFKSLVKKYQKKHPQSGVKVSFDLKAEDGQIKYLYRIQVGESSFTGGPLDEGLIKEITSKSIWTKNTFMEDRIQEVVQKEIKRAISEKTNKAYNNAKQDIALISSILPSKTKLQVYKSVDSKFLNFYLTTSDGKKSKKAIKTDEYNKKALQSWVKESN